MSGSSTKGSERSPLLSPEQSNSDTNSCQSFPDMLDLDAPDADASLPGSVPFPSSPARHGVTVLSGTLIVVSLGVLVFLQGTMGFPACDSRLLGNVNEGLLAFVQLPSCLCYHHFDLDDLVLLIISGSLGLPLRYVWSFSVYWYLWQLTIWCSSSFKCVAPHHNSGRDRSRPGCI